MPVLLLARGDAQAKDMLRRAIEARYGVTPPAIDHLQIDLKGRARVKVGPIHTWVPMDISAQFRFPTASRWDFVVKPAGLAVQRGVEAFDGGTYRYLRGNNAPEVSVDEEMITSLQRRLWAMAAVLLTPLGEHFVELEWQDDYSLQAHNTMFKDGVSLCLRDDYSLERVEVPCLNPDNQQQQLFSLRLSQEQEPVNGIMMPCRISAYWDDTPYFEAEPVRVENSTTIPDVVFALG